MAVFPEEAGRANDDVQAVNTGLDRELGIAHVAADVFVGFVSLVDARGGVDRRRSRWLTCQDLGLLRAVSRQIHVFRVDEEDRTFRPSLQMASQSLRDCSDAAGEVSSM